MSLSRGNAVILFRFHDDVSVARSRIRLLQLCNPGLPVHAFFGGAAADLAAAKEDLQDIVVETTFFAEDRPAAWKWTHTDLMLKYWYRRHGRQVDFDFLYSYEYDLLTLAPLVDLYPDIDQRSIALAAAQEFTVDIERRWDWTSSPDLRPSYERFRQHMHAEYGIERQRYVSLGPGPLLSRTFLDVWSKTADVDYVHDELAYPAYAEALGFNVVNHGMHPGFGAHPEAEKFFGCEPGVSVPLQDIVQQARSPAGRRSFHPVKYQVGPELLSEVAATT